MVRLILIVFLLLPALSYSSLSTLPVAFRAEGQTFEPCQEDVDCVDDRLCITNETRTQCSSGATCVCAPPVLFKGCLNSDDCEEGELCAAGIREIPYICISARVVNSNPDLSEVDATTDTPQNPGDGLTAEQCRTDLQCQGARQCINYDPNQVVICLLEAPRCVCSFPTGFQRCSSSPQCPKGEVCTKGVAENRNVCIGQKTVDADDDFEQVDQRPTGLTFDPCRETITCTGQRLCADGDGIICVGPSTPCFCTPFGGLLFCGSKEDCLGAEVCGIGFLGGRERNGICMSQFAVDTTDGVETYDGEGNGVTFAPCIGSGGCMGNRLCAALDSVSSPSLRECAGNEAFCVCAPKSGAVFCNSSSECPAGEECAVTESFGQICMSAEAIDGTVFVKVPEESPPAIVSASPTLSPTGPATTPADGSGLTLDTCVGSSGVNGCKSPRECYVLGSEFGLTTEFCSEEADECVCASRDLMDCMSSADCINGEVCARGFPFPSGRNICTSGKAFSEFELEEVTEEDLFTPSPSVNPVTLEPPTPSPVEGDTPPPSSSPPSSASGGSTTPSSSAETEVPSPGTEPDQLNPSPSPESAICVDARALAHLKPEELVFDKHNLANVLCDESGSCATPGHMVVFQGKVMMMRTYCETVLCEERLLAVNSPRYRRKLRVKSNTKGLLYTAFAARYATRGEELALSTLSRAGL